MIPVLLPAVLSQLAPYMLFYGGPYDTFELRGHLGIRCDMGDMRAQDKILRNPRLCGGYLEILTNPSTTRAVVVDSLIQLAEMPYVHPGLLAVIINWATHDHIYVRAGVLDFIGAHGGERQLPLVAAMLFDHDPYVGFAAADALQRIGTAETQRVFDVWLAGPPRPGDDGLRAHVLKRAEELRTRLAK